MLYTATLTIMSPSEVIIEVYIMPEDASFGACFSFSLKTLFLYSRAGGKRLQDYPSMLVAGLATPPGSSWLLEVGEQEEAGRGIIQQQQIPVCPPPPQGSLHNWGSVCKGFNPLTPSLASRVPLSHSNGRRHYIEPS